MRPISSPARSLRRRSPRSRRLRWAAVASVAAALTVFAGAATAGVGIFGEYGRNMATSGGTVSIGGFNVANPGLWDSNDLSVGIAFDSNLARDSLLNSRVDLGFHVSLPSNDGGLVNTGYGGVLAWALGFGVVRNENMRLWIGPDLRLDVDWYGNTFGTPNTDFVDVQVGVGPRIGLNLHTGGNTTVTLSGGYDYKWGWLAFPNAITTGTVSHRDHYVSVNLAFFWRGSGDVFE